MSDRNNPIIKILREILRKFFPVVVACCLISGCSGLSTDDDYANQTAEQLYAQASAKMSKKSWQTAIEILRALEANYPYGDYAEQAQLDTIYCYFRNEDSVLALAAADRFIKLHPTHESVDYAYYLKGLVSFNEDGGVFGRLLGLDNLSNRDSTAIYNALLAFEDVYTLFPESQYAPESKKRAQSLFNALAKHEITVANYYYSRDAYVAAVNRAKNVVEEYSTTPYVERALAIMMASYEKMGFDDLKHDSRRILELNYPQSAYLSENL